jgi:hypothetical protein
MSDVIVDVFHDQIFYEDMKAYTLQQQYKQIRLQSKYHFIRMYSINPFGKKSHRQDYYFSPLSSKLDSIQSIINEGIEQNQKY